MKILITGGDGLVGNAFKKINFSNDEVVFIDKKNIDLINRRETIDYILSLRPEVVIHTAARVGGIQDNILNGSQLFSENILINTNVIDACHIADVKTLLAFSSLCVFPDGIDVIRESDMHKGNPHESNAPYAYAKRMIDVQIHSYQRIKKRNWTSIIPCNIFGTHDRYDLINGHVIPSLIRKTYEASKNKSDLVVWGDGLASREFIFADDLAEICHLLLKKDILPERIIISGNQVLTIKNIVDLLCKISNFEGNVVYSTDKPTGQKTRKSDNTLFKKLAPDFRFKNLEDSLGVSYRWYENNHEGARKS